MMIKIPEIKEIRFSLSQQTALFQKIISCVT